MPKRPKYELVQCTHFAWRLSRRAGIWYADGRTNSRNAGRHSLGTRDKAEARQLLPALDEARAYHLGLINVRQQSTASNKLHLIDGRRLFEEHIGRPRVTGGVRPSTRKRYRAILDKFVAWATNNAVQYCHEISAPALNRYGQHLQDQGYAPKTQHAELTLLKQVVRYLVESEHLCGCEPIKLRLTKVQGQRAYCYTPEEVKSILARCRAQRSLSWLGDVVTGLACTGMRIAELANLRWPDIDFDNGRITVVDESGLQRRNETVRTVKSGQSRWLPLHPDLRAVLECLPRLDQFVFHGPQGGRVKPDFVRRTLLKHVLEPLAPQYPATSTQGFVDGRLHSFRHYFVSRCAANNVSERMVMEWVGHADSAMVRHYYHLVDQEAKRRMDALELLGSADGRSGRDIEVP